MLDLNKNNSSYRQAIQFYEEQLNGTRITVLPFMSNYLFCTDTF